MSGRVRVGTSGWTDDSWAGVFHVDGHAPNDAVALADRCRTAGVSRL